MIQMVTPYGIKLVFVQKIAFCSYKIQQKLLPPELHFMTSIYTNRFRLELWPIPHWGNVQRSPDPDPIAVFRGPTPKGKGKEGMGRKRGGKGRREKEGTLIYEEKRKVGAYL